MEHGPETPDLQTTKEIFFAALECEGPARRELLGRVRDQDGQRFARLERLLRAHEDGPSDWTRGLFDVVQPDVEETGPASGTAKRIGDYELCEQVGQGASGVVWRARQVSLGRIVALKLLRTAGLADAREVERFRAEAGAVARLDHPNIVPVYEVGDVEGRPYFSMRWIDGRDLASQTGTCWEPRRAARFMLIVARAVHHAHQRGLLHRDLKPSNILLSADGTPHVADFGIALRLDETVAEEALVGTPLYMAPEQVKQDVELTVATDVWALGCILFEMLAGAPPFQGRSIPEVLFQVCEVDVDPPAALRGSARPLGTILQACLRKPPADRYASAQALAEDLERWLSHVPIRARQARPLERVALAWRRSPVTVSLVALTVLLVLALAVGASWTGVVRKRGLRESLLLAARATRLSGQPGRREAALDLAVRAGQLRPGPDVRNEMVASLALTDLRVSAERPLPAPRFGSLAFDGDLERYAWTSLDGGVFVSSIVGDRAEVRLPAPEPADLVDFSPDGRRLLVRYPGEGAGRVRVWDLAASRTPVVEAEGYPEGEAYDFSPDGALLAFGSGSGELAVVDLDARRELWRIGAGATITAVEFAGDGHSLALAVDSEASNLRIIEVSTRHVSASSALPDLPADVDWLNDDSAVVAACDDGHVYSWTPGTKEPGVVFRGHEAEVVRVRVSPTSPLLVTYSWDETLRLWDSRSGELLLTVDAMVLRFSDDGRFLAFRTTTALGVMALDHEQVVRVLVGHLGKNPEYVGFGPDDSWLWSAGSDGARRWDLARGVSEPLFGPDLAQLVLLDDGDRCVCRLQERVELRSLEDPGWSEVLFAEPVREIDASRDGGTVVWGTPDRLHVVHRGGQERRIEIPIEPQVRRFDLSADGRWLASGTWGGVGVQVWDTSSGERVARLFPGAFSASVLFSPDARHLAIGRATDYVLLDRTTMREVFSVVRNREHGRYGGPIAFTEDGALLAVGIERGVVALHDVATGAEVLRLEPPVRRPFNAMRFSEDGARLALASGSNRVLLWDLGAIRRELEALGLDPR